MKICPIFHLAGEEKYSSVAASLGRSVAQADRLGPKVGTRATSIK